MTGFARQAAPGPMAGFRSVAAAWPSQLAAIHVNAGTGRHGYTAPARSSRPAGFRLGELPPLCVAGVPRRRAWRRSSSPGWGTAGIRACVRALPLAGLADVRRDCSQRARQERARRLPRLPAERGPQLIRVLSDHHVWMGGRPAPPLRHVAGAPSDVLGTDDVVWVLGGERGSFPFLARQHRLVRPGKPAAPRAIAPAHPCDRSQNADVVVNSVLSGPAAKPRSCLRSRGSGGRGARRLLRHRGGSARGERSWWLRAPAGPGRPLSGRVSSAACSCCRLGPVTMRRRRARSAQLIARRPRRRRALPRGRGRELRVLQIPDRHCHAVTVLR